MARPERGAGYAIATLVAAIAALWLIGPLTAVGTLFGLSILVAGTALPTRALVAVVGVALVAIGARTGLGGATAFELARGGRLELGLGVWIALTASCGGIAWIAIRILTATFASLERAYARTAEAYRAELEVRDQVAGSRAQLEELAQVEMVGRLAGGVAHDINNALTAILAAAEVLEGEVATADQRRHLAELGAASNHAADLVRDLLWTGRRFPASGSASADLDAAARSCLERVSRVTRAIAVDVQIDRALEVAVSAEHLEQILFGLIVGADRFGVHQLRLTAGPGEPGRVQLVLAGATDGATDGAMDDASAASETRAMRFQLAVSAASELIGQYGGALVLRTDADAVHVMLAIPAQPGSQPTAPVAPRPMRTALVVEDEPMVLRMLCKLVKRRGYDVSAATTVAEALERLAAGPDLLITDMQLPDGSGAAIALASFEQNPRRTIIVCSGFSVDDVRRGPLEHAALTFLAKPFTSADFEAAVPAIVAA